MPWPDAQRWAGLKSLCRELGHRKAEALAVSADNEPSRHVGKVFSRLWIERVMCGGRENPWWLSVNQHFEEAETVSRQCHSGRKGWAMQMWNEKQKYHEKREIGQPLKCPQPWVVSEYLPSESIFSEFCSEKGIGDRVTAEKEGPWVLSKQRISNSSPHHKHTCGKVLFPRGPWRQRGRL